MGNQIIAWFWSWDTSNKAKITSAYTAGVLGGLTPDYRLALYRVRRDRIQFPDLPQVVADEAQPVFDKLEAVVIEDQASGTQTLQTIRASSDQALAAKLVEYRPAGSKIERGQRAGVWCKRGCVLLPHPSTAAPWLHAFENELFNAPDTQYMDQHDAFSQLVNYTEHLLAAGWHARGCPMLVTPGMN
jgi:predicted phage terminase large subunit-like protein